MVGLLSRTPKAVAPQSRLQLPLPAISSNSKTLTVGLLQKRDDDFVHKACRHSSQATST